MIKVYDTEVTDKDEFLCIMAEDLSGTTNSERSVFKYKEYAEGIKFFNITTDDFSDHLKEKDIIECNECGWWTYEGQSDSGTCEDCLALFEEEEEEDNE